MGYLIFTCVLITRDQSDLCIVDFTGDHPYDILKFLTEAKDEEPVLQMGIVEEVNWQ